jgi:uncharacterized small protein (TIGR04563 family)
MLGLPAAGAPNAQDLSGGTEMAGTDKRKQSLYFPEDMLREIQEEANRQDRSLSWIVQQAWKIARGEIMRFPSVNDVIGTDAPRTTEDRE